MNRKLKKAVTAMSEIGQVIVDRSGKIRIPKAIRLRLGLGPGDRLEIETREDEEIRLRPLRETPMLVDKAGVLVVRAAVTGELDSIEKGEREDRLAVLIRRAGL